MEDYTDINRMINESNYYARFFSKSSALILNDWNKNNKNEITLTNATRNNVVEWLKRPYAGNSQERLRTFSDQMYAVSTHYKSLIDYHSTILKYNYILTPRDGSVFVDGNFDVEKYREAYIKAATRAEKMRIKEICKKITKRIVTVGVYFGVYYENDDSFYVREVDMSFAKITSIENGVYKYALDLKYFNGKKEYLLDGFPQDVQRAYRKYSTGKGDRYYEPKEQICVLWRDDGRIILPYFVGLLKDIFDIEESRLLNRANDRNNNYKAIALEIPTDENGNTMIPEPIIEKYYRQAALNIPDSVGLIATPFKLSEVTFNRGTNNATRELSETESQFWFDSGTSPLLFGSAKATTKGALELSIKSNEELARSILDNITDVLNLILSNTDNTYKFMFKFTDDTIYNSSADVYYKAATAGVGGAKMLYAASLGLSPLDVATLSNVEDNVLGLVGEQWTRPLKTSYTQSSSDDEGGRPTLEDKDLTDEGEKSRDKNGE